MLIVPIIVLTIFLIIARNIHDLQAVFSKYVNIYLSVPSLNNLIRLQFHNFAKIYIVIEDIDRSQDGGIFFLETLNYFLKNYKLNKQIIVIAPLNSDYLKSLDYTYDFTKHYDFATFAKELLDFNKIRTKDKSFNPKDCYDNWIGHDCETIISQLTSIFRSAYSGGCSLRKIKLILRNSNTLYKTLDPEEKEKIDIRLWLIFSFSRYISKIQLTSQTTSINKHSNQQIMRLIYVVAKNDRLK